MGVERGHVGSVAFSHSADGEWDNFRGFSPLGQIVIGRFQLRSLFPPQLAAIIIIIVFAFVLATTTIALRCFLISWTLHRHPWELPKGDDPLPRHVFVCLPVLWLILLFTVSVSGV